MVTENRKRECSEVGGVLDNVGECDEHTVFHVRPSWECISVIP